uniref:Uncharacterized protein n=1 Tax=Sipha flava TaxID=143950 RepID=A0A2S2R7S7_9HEMI
MASIYLSLVSPNFKALFNADDIVLFYSDKSLDRSVNILNILFTKLFASLFTIVPEKSYFMIFTRKQITAYLHLVLENQIVLPSFSVRIGHSLLPHQSFKLSFNSSPLCTLHNIETVCNFNHIIFHCPSLSPSRHLFSFHYFGLSHSQFKSYP